MMQSAKDLKDITHSSNDHVHCSRRDADSASDMAPRFSTGLIPQKGIVGDAVPFGKRQRVIAGRCEHVLEHVSKL
jgi:hypothetical protein